MKFKSKLLVFILFVFVLGTVLIACGNQTSTDQSNSERSADSDETIVIKIADHLPTTHLISENGTLPWIERIEELGEGRIEVDYYPAEQLGKVDSMLQLVQNKVADIAFIVPQWNGDVMPLGGISGMPGLIADSVSGSKAYHKLITEDLYELEFQPNGIKPLWAAVLSPYQVTNSKKPIETLDDFKGLKLRTADPLQEEMMYSWGAAPVTMPGSDMYQAWERGIVDGTLISFSSWPGYQLDQIAKYSTTNASLSQVGLTFSVNEVSWNSWPEDVQDILTQASEEIVEQFAIGIIETEEELMVQYQEDSGIEFYEIPEDELEKWNEDLRPFSESWAKGLDERGLPGTEILESFLEYNEEFEK